MKRAILSVTNDLVSDQRLNRSATTLKKCGYKVILVGRKLPNSLPYEGEFQFIRLRLLFNKGPLFYAEFNFKLFFLLVYEYADLYFSNDLDTLPANFLAAKFHGNRIVYDSHEYFTGVPELLGRRITRNIWRFFEKLLLPKIHNLITVSEGVATQYKSDYNVKMKVIRNVPFSAVVANGYLEKNSAQKTIIYQGALNKDRGLELMIRSLKYIDNAVLLIIGSGDIERQLHELAKEEDVIGRIIFTGKVPFGKLPAYSAKADLGISLEEDSNPNYRFALPNKLFDYIQAQIPVLVSDLPEMAAIVRNYGVGEVCINRTPEMMAMQIIDIIENKNKYLQNLKKAAIELCWEKESEKLEEIIHSLNN
jgi:glycosyltransferase involved in cell wall biosynthesis